MTSIMEDVVGFVDALVAYSSSSPPPPDAEGGGGIGSKDEESCSVDITTKTAGGPDSPSWTVASLTPYTILAVYGHPSSFTSMSISGLFPGAAAFLDALTSYIRSGRAGLVSDARRAVSKLEEERGRLERATSGSWDDRSRSDSVSRGR